MCPTSCDLFVAQNPKAFNPSTGEIVFLARENSSGKLVWIRASDGQSPPPDQIITKASADGRIPEEMINKLRNSTADGINPVLLVQGEGVNIAGSGLISTTSGTAEGGGLSKGIGEVRKRDSEDDTASADSEAEKTKRAAFKKSGKSAMKCDKAVLQPPISRQASAPTSKPRSKRRKFDINHRKLKKPKRPKTGYNYFQLSIRDKLCDKISMDDRVLHNETVARIIGKKWKALSKQERKVFQNLAEQDKCRYERELKEYLQKMYELGADGRYTSSTNGSERKKVQSRRCFSFDATAGRSKKSSQQQLERAAGLGLTQHTAMSLSTSSGSGSSEGADLLSSTLGKNDRDMPDFLKEKSKLGASISASLNMGMPSLEKERGAGLGPPNSKMDKWLDDALSIHMGRESRIRSSLSCDNITHNIGKSNGLFNPSALFADSKLNDRKFSSPFLSNDIYMRDNSFLDNTLNNTLKSPEFPSLSNIDSIFFKEFSSWDTDCS
mmetsp:Transcript_13122/g.23827  ORF Transcript_13122/g.23827 Transcript_13122/m.23827 type:complete len:495 (+) Transcript_13122:43-1527(+)